MIRPSKDFWCEGCERWFANADDWDESDIQQEAKENGFDTIPIEQQMRVCDECYLKAMKWARTQKQ